ncbi:MAG: hypothetical protein AVDCRST_MAG45-1033, partial [uncultured Solirubrobacterales bacterium]
ASPFLGRRGGCPACCRRRRGAESPLLLDRAGRRLDGDPRAGRGGACGRPRPHLHHPRHLLRGPRHPRPGRARPRRRQRRGRRPRHRLARGPAHRAFLVRSCGRRATQCCGRGGAAALALPTGNRRALLGELSADRARQRGGRGPDGPGRGSPRRLPRLGAGADRLGRRDRRCLLRLLTRREDRVGRRARRCRVLAAAPRPALGERRPRGRRSVRHLPRRGGLEQRPAQGHGPRCERRRSIRDPGAQRQRRRDRAGRWM